MKFNFITSIIAIAISALISYAFYAFNSIITEKEYLLITASFLVSAVTLLGALGIKFDYGRTTIVIGTLSWAFFLVSLIILIILNSVNVGVPLIIISIGILLLLYILIAYSIVKTKH